MPRSASLALPVALLSLCGCAEQQPQPSPFTGMFRTLATCRDEYVAMDARIDAAGVRDGAYYRVPGYPYLRTDRTLASYANDLRTQDQIDGWLRHMREFDQEAREFEYINLGLPLQERADLRNRFLNCGRGLAAIELDDPAAFERMKASVQPDDEYSGLARTLGLYPLAVPILQSRIDAEQEAVKRDFATPLAELDAPGPLLVWRVKPLKDPQLAARGFDKSLPDELGIPGLVDSEWQALAELHAPTLWVETRGEEDRPGAPMWTHTDAGTRASVDSSQPLVNFTVGFTRFGGNPAVQFTYFVWFKDADGSRLIDGTMWRVTLDTHARPLVYESLQASGRGHLWFPVQPLTRRENGSVWHEPDLFPQDQVPALHATLRLAAGTHALRRVVTPEQATGGEAHTYELRRYEDLYTLPLPDGGTRSLFGPDGIVPGTERPDPTWLWASGVGHPGALRQYGHHVTAYIGRSLFDDPFLLESVFVPPAQAEGPPPG